MDCLHLKLELALLVCDLATLSSLLVGVLLQLDHLALEGLVLALQGLKRSRVHCVFSKVSQLVLQLGGRDLATHLGIVGQLELILKLQDLLLLLINLGLQFTANTLKVGNVSILLRLCC